MDADNVFCASLHECFASVLRFGLIDSFLVCMIILAVESTCIAMQYYYELYSADKATSQSAPVPP